MQDRRLHQLGDWAPDLPTIMQGEAGALSIAKGVVPMASGGYGPMPTPLDLGKSAIDSRARGYGVARDKGGVTYNFAGTETKLHMVVAAGTSDVSRTVGGAYALPTRAHWEFAVFNNIVYAVQVADTMQFYNLASSTDFENLASPPPKAAHIGVVEDFVVIADLDDAGTIYHQGVQWSAVGNGSSWPTPGSGTAAEVQSGRQPNLGGEGRAQRVIGGPEVGLVMLERGLFRMDFVGGDLGFAFYRTEPERGLLVPSAACGKGRVVLYLDEDGWFLSDFTSSVEVGKALVDRWFFNDIAAADMHRISMVADPESTRFWIGYRSSSASSSSCDRVLVYDWSLRRWAYGDEAHELLCRVLQLTQTLDDLGSASLDTEPLASSSLDDFEQAGPSKLGCWGTDHKIKSISGAAQDAVLQTGDLALGGNRVALLQGVYPFVRGAIPTVQVSGILTPDEAHEFGPSVARNREGRHPVRQAGRYHAVRVNIPGGNRFEATAFESSSTVMGDG